MGRLFWKFLLAFWLAQLLTVLGVGLTLGLVRGGPPPRDGIQLNGHDPRMPPPFRPEEGAPAPGIGALQEPGGPAPHAMPAPAPRPDAPPFRIDPHLPTPDLPLLPLFAGTLVSLLFAALLARYFSRPIQQLNLALAAFADGQLDARVGPMLAGRHDELADLGQGFDHMALRLQQALENRQRLLHDVSHELRSPLARLRAAGELVRQQPERSAELLERMERDIARMDKLVGEVLMLDRLDALRGAAAGTQVNLAELLTAVVQDASFEAQAKECRIDFTPSAPTWTFGQAEQLHRAIDNVLRHALAHAPAGSTVSVALQAQQNQTLMTVADEGPAVFPGDLDRLFEPFYRAAGDGRTDGLGLAITRRIVLRHGGKVVAVNRDKAGLLIRLTLPAQADATS